MLEYFFSYDQMTYSLGISVSMLSSGKRQNDKNPEHSVNT